MEISNIGEYLIGGGITAILGGVGFFLKAKFIPRQEKANTISKEADAIGSILEKSAKLDDRWQDFMKQTEAFYKEKFTSLSKEIDKLSDSLKEYDEKIKALEEKVNKSEDKLSKRDYIIRQAFKCEKVVAPLDCPVLRKQKECDDAKDRKIHLKKQ